MIYDLNDLENDGDLLSTFEKNNLRRILDDTCDNGLWQRYFDHEMYETYDEPP